MPVTMELKRDTRGRVRNTANIIVPSQVLVRAGCLEYKKVNSTARWRQIVMTSTILLLKLLMFNNNLLRVIVLSL